MKTITIMKIIQLIINGISAIAVFIIGLWQIKIHNRLKQLEESIALSMVPNPPTFQGLRLINSGKINLYLRRATIGEINRDYPNLVLVAIGKDPYFLLSFSQEELKRAYEKNERREIEVKLYLKDEWEKKYIVGGRIKISPVIIKEKSEHLKESEDLKTNKLISSNEEIYYIINSAWVSQIEKYNWQL